MPEFATAWCSGSDGCRRNRSADPAGGAFQRTVVKWDALYLPVRWPKGVPTRPEVEQGAGGRPPRAFDVDCAALVTCIERFCDPKQLLDGRSHSGLDLGVL
jgi:hypothetical protein